MNVSRSRLFFTRPLALLALLAATTFAPALRAQAVIPAWWAERNVFSSLPTDNNAVVTAEQLYNFALAALLEIDSKLVASGGADPDLWAALQIVGAPVPLAGLHAEYFNTGDLTGTPVLVREEAAGTSYDWGEGGSPASPGPGVNARGFSARWTGELILAADGLYVFQVNPTNGETHLWVNGLEIPVGRRYALPLLAGQAASIRLEYRAPVSSEYAAGLQVRWSAGPDPAASQDSFKLYGTYMTTHGELVGTGSYFGVNTPDYENGQSVESLQAEGRTLLTGGPITTSAYFNYYHGYVHSASWLPYPATNAVLLYGAETPNNPNTLTGNIGGVWDLTTIPADGVLALTDPADLQNDLITDLHYTIGSWFYIGLFYASDFAEWEQMALFGETNTLGEFRTYQNLSLLNGTVGRLREFANLLRARLVALGYTGLPALPAGGDGNSLTVGELKALFGFDLDNFDADGNGLTFAQETLLGLAHGAETENLTPAVAGLALYTPAP